MNTKSTALRLAEYLELPHIGQNKSAAELRRLHEENQALRQALAQPEQEPYPEGDVVGPCICGSWPGGKCLKCKRIAPPKREWVGLTDNDLRQIILAAVGVAEAKLKEKNHGPW